MIIIPKETPDLEIYKWNEKTKNLIRGKSGIYAIYLGIICLYVGASKNLSWRGWQAFYPKRIDNLLLKVILLNYQTEIRLKKHKPYLKIFFYPLKAIKELEQYHIFQLNARLNVNQRLYRNNWELFKKWKGAK